MSFATMGKTNTLAFLTLTAIDTSLECISLTAGIFINFGLSIIYSTKFYYLKIN